MPERVLRLKAVAEVQLRQNQWRYDALPSRLWTYIRPPAATSEDPTGKRLAIQHALRLCDRYQREAGTGGDHEGRILDGPGPTHVQVNAA